MYSTFEHFYFIVDGNLLQLGWHLYFSMEFAEAMERKVMTLEEKTVEAEKELCGALAHTFEVEQAF